MIDVHDIALNGLSRLKILDISRNKLIKAPSLSLVTNTLEVLNLSWNKIRHINNMYFNWCRKMKSVHLDSNQLINIPNIQSISKTVTLLSLGGNRITTAMPMYGIYFPRLNHLQLSSNLITSFCFLPAHSAPVLREVFLHSNNLSRISFSDTYSLIKREVLITLGDNPWHCDGSLGWTQQCTPVTLHEVLCMGWLKMKGMMICASPQNVTGLFPYKAGMVCSCVPCHNAVIHHAFLHS